MKTIIWDDDDEISLRSFKRYLFYARIRAYEGDFGLLILNGYSRHLTSQFNRICAETNIISLCMLRVLRSYYNRLMLGVLQCLNLRAVAS